MEFDRNKQFPENQKNLISTDKLRAQSIGLEIKYDNSLEEPNTYEVYKTVIYNSSYTTLFSFLFFFNKFVSIIMVGYLNDFSLISSFGLGALFIEFLFNSFNIGIGDGLHTLCSQTYGSGQYVLMGVFVNISRLLTLGFFFLIFVPIAYFSEEILVLIGQDPALAYEASRFIHSMIPGMALNIIFNTTNIYIESMQIYTPGIVIFITSLALHIFSTYFFMFYLDYKLIGLGFAYFITNLMGNLIIFTYLNLFNPNPKSFFFFHRDCLDLKYIEDFLNIAIPSVFLYSSDHLGFEALSLMCSYLGSKDLATNIIFLSYTDVHFNFFYGISQAMVTLVGNAIGSNDERLAKKYYFCGIMCTISLSIFSSLFSFFLRNYVAYVYTSDQEIILKVSYLVGFYSLFILIDSIQVALHGVIKGLGAQKFASIVTLIVFFPINLSIASILAFYFEFGVYGLWYSQFISIILIMTSFLFYLNRLDWCHIANEFQESISQLKKNE